MMMRASAISLRMGLAHAVRHWAKFQPHKPALVDESDTVTYGELGRRIDSIRAALRGLSLGRQAPVGLAISDKPHLVASLCAVLGEAHSAIITNPTLSRSQIGTMVKDSYCPLLLTDGATRTEVAGLERDDLRVVRIDDVPIDTSARQPELEPRHADDVWGVIYSSGTTGEPKGVVHTDLSMLSELIHWCFELPLTRGSTSYVGRPVYYAGGLVITTATLLVGGTVLAPRLHEIETYDALLKRHPADVSFLLPDQARALVRERKRTPGGPSPRKMLLMGGPSTPELKLAVRETLGCPCIESWGNTEGLGTITEAEDLDRRPSSIGRPFLGDHMLIVGDDGMPLPPGEVGRIAGLADSTCREYRNRYDLNRSAFVGDLVISEDLGYIDESGYFHIVGRTIERILRQGTPVFASDIERTVLQAGEVSEIAVVAQDDAAEGQVPVAVISGAPDARAADDLLHRINETLPPLCRLAALHIIPKLPRNAAGKINIAAVKSLIKSEARAADASGAAQGARP